MKTTTLGLFLAFILLWFEQVSAGLEEKPNWSAEWLRMVATEPCMNGDISSTGAYPTQRAEDMSYASMGVWASLLH